jgi:hypothetical protein
MGIKEIKGYLSKLKIEVNDVVIIYGITTFTKLIEEDKDYVYIIDKLSKINHDVE